MNTRPKYEIGAKDALIIIDMQKDFCLPNGKLYVAGVLGEPTMDVVEQNCSFLAGDFGFPFIVSTFDRHPRGHVEFGIYGEHVLEGTSGAEYVDLLADPNDWSNMILMKGSVLHMISYSIAVSDQFPELIRQLRARGITRIFVAGVAYTHCAGESAIALSTQSDPTNPWEVFIVRDATCSVPPPYGNPDLMGKKLALYGVKEVFMADLV